MKEILIPLNFTTTPTVYDTLQSFSTSDEASGVLTFTTTADVAGTVASLTIRNASENANRQMVLIERLDVNSSPFSYAFKNPLPFGQYEGTVLLKKNLTVIASASFLFGVNSSLSAEVLPDLVKAYSLDELVENVETEVSNLKDAFTLTVSETVKGVNKTESSLQAQENVRYLNEHQRKANERERIANENARIAAEVERKDTFDTLVDSEVIEQTVVQEVANEFQQIESTYANRLLSTEQQLAETATKAELSAIATPKAVTLLAEMTDVAKIYVYTGVEGGHVAGNWYYHNGTAWTSGGVYQATGLTDESVTAKKLNKETKPTYKITDIGVGSFLTPARIPEYDVNTNIVVIQEDGAAGLAWIDVTKNDKIIKGKLDANIGIYWGKGLILTDLNNRYVEFWDVPYITTNTLPFVVYDAETRYFTIDVVAMLASYPATKRIFVVYTAEFLPELTKTLDYSDLKFLAPIPVDEELVLPSVIPCVVGHEMNCYWENALLYGRMNSVQKIDTEYTLDASERLQDRFVWKPTGPGITPMKVMLWKKSLKQYDDAKVVSFKAVSSTAGSGTKKVLVIGDSKTAYGQVVRKLKGLFDADTTMDVEYLGTRYDNNNSGDVTYKHEGRAGWTVSDYVRIASKDGISNPFYNGATFDFANYMTTNVYADVDYVFINLSTNDFGRTTDAVITDLSMMIASIEAYNTAVRIIVCLSEGVYRNKIEWDARNTWFIELKKAMITAFDRREQEKIYVCPLYLNMDLYEDYDLTSVPLSSEDPTKTRLMTTDGIHQNQIGFNKNANTMYYTIKYIESLG